MRGVCDTIHDKINHKSKTRYTLDSKKDQSAYAIYVNKVKSPDLVQGLIL
jgi:hypothetical protein